MWWNGRRGATVSFPPKFARAYLDCCWRISGETAPLLFTALNNQFFSLNLNAPMASLPTTIFQFALSPYEDWQNLAWAGALLITFTILVLNIVARMIASRSSFSR